ncbi:hypothetical protein Cob_v001325 [Colletotrichum orbiculare MAFF 240422]|uniref:Cyclase n=1 Tax=Colletotrichum orbiculare (strain 104-T / ATCC 96160 / CBS 514.97 / LARS 414 / MAFF 240422) TaxID=1213857 RepID=N4W5P8_COLOR|nr:hypothetical protein Cob_v001325 [Colletotrichum orbiculare MAFF 240422]
MASLRTDPLNLPDFDDLPPVEGMPQGCAWGLFDRDGNKDVYGTLNLLTPEVVQAASSEVKDGVSISLNWTLDGMNKLGIPGRKPTGHNILSFREGMSVDASAWDDELEFNTQASSQWDSLVHWQHQPSGLAYNNVKPCHEDMSATTTGANKLPTLDHWHSRGGIVGRGVLIDWKAYADEKGIENHPFDGNSVTVEDIEAVAAHQGVEFKPGDVFLIRFGATEVIDNLQPEDMAKLANMKLSGVEGSVETAKWFWNKHFSAVVADASAFEVFPPVKPDGSVGSMADLVLHPYFLSLFGLPIGELWDLSRLSQHCKKTGRYTFMLTSVPLNIPCLVGSPPNALAIF